MTTKVDERLLDVSSDVLSLLQAADFDAVISLLGLDATCTLTLSSAQSYTANGPAQVLLDTASVDVGEMADVANNRVTIAAAGTYALSCSIYFTSGIAAGDIGEAFIRVNGSEVNHGRLHAGAAFDFTVSAATRYVTLAAGDYVTLAAAKNGSNSSIYTDAGATWLCVRRVGP